MPAYKNSDSDNTCLDFLTFDLRNVSKKIHLTEKFHFHLKKNKTLSVGASAVGSHYFCECNVIIQ